MQISDMIEGPIKMVTFDLYDTLVEADPPGWDRFNIALQRVGYDIPRDEVMRAYTAGQRFFTQENGRVPIRDRGEDGIAEFRRNLTGVSLEALGLPTDRDTLIKVMTHFQDETQRHGELKYRTFDDVPGMLQLLKKNRIMRGVISNADDDVTRFCLHMGFAEQMDIIVTSALVGWEKPDARTFYAALEPFNLPASSVLHVGDQPESDIVGARAIGMAAVLLDRYDQYPDEPHDALRVNSLDTLTEILLDYNRSFVD